MYNSYGAKPDMNKEYFDYDDRKIHRRSNLEDKKITKYNIDKLEHRSKAKTKKELRSKLEEMREEELWEEWEDEIS